MTTVDGLSKFNFVNDFNLIKLNEIVDDRKITGSCAVNLKLKFYNGHTSACNLGVTFLQVASKIFKNDYGYYCGLQKNLSLEDYYCYGRNFNHMAEDIHSLTNKQLQRDVFYDSFNNVLAENYIYYMPNGYCTSYLYIGSVSNNSMIIFNTDPDNDFTYDFTIDSSWKISKPFNFEKGKSYCIATEGYCIFWCEVQNYE